MLAPLGWKRRRLRTPSPRRCLKMSSPISGRMEAQLAGLENLASSIDPNTAESAPVHERRRQTTVPNSSQQRLNLRKTFVKSNLSLLCLYEGHDMQDKFRCGPLFPPAAGLRLGCQGFVAALRLDIASSIYHAIHQLRLMDLGRGATHATTWVFTAMTSFFIVASRGTSFLLYMFLSSSLPSLLSSQVL